VHLKQFQCLLDQISKVVSLSLTVVDFVAQVCILDFEKVHDWQDLSVVGYECLSNGVRAGHEGLQNFESNGDDLWVSCVQGGLDWDNELWDDWEDLGTTLLKHIEDTVHGQESVWIHFLSDTLEEDWQVMMVIELLDLDLPINLVLWTKMLNCNGQITAIVEKSELTHWDLSPAGCASYWLLGLWLKLWHIQASALSTETVTLLQNGGTCGCDRNFLFVDRFHLRNPILSFLHPIFWEITKSRVLVTWQVFIVIGLPLVAGGHG